MRHSKALRGLLEYTLALGNYLNGQSSKGGAWGFKLEALAKLANTKTLDNQRVRRRRARPRAWRAAARPRRA